MKILAIRGIDTLLFRDGRPFDTTPGGRAETLRVPLPSTVAGFLRTKLGRYVNGTWEGDPNALKLRGPLLALNGEPVFPAPADAVVIREKDAATAALMTLRPWSADDLKGGCDLPGGMIPLKVTHEGKPDNSYRYWNREEMERWLLDGWDGRKPPCKIEGPQTDIRTHLEVDREKGAAREGMLFTTEMVAFERHAHRPKRDVEVGKDEWSLLCRVESDAEAASLTGPGPLGGENRLASIEPASVEWPSCPEALRTKLSKAAYVRMILATPAIFELGWIPRWLDKTTKEGSPPGLEGKLTLKLVSAAVPRRQAISGWDLENSRPKPVRWMAPAGSVYFFEVKGGDPAVLATEGWLAPVSDDEETPEPHRPVSKNRDDGFGLALWGVWNGKEEPK